MNILFQPEWHLDCMEQQAGCLLEMRKNMLDDNIYEDNTTYKLVMDDVDGTIKDSDIGNHLRSIYKRKWQNLTTTKKETYYGKI